MGHHNIGKIVLKVMYILLAVALFVFVISFGNLMASGFTLTQIVMDLILKGITSVDYNASVNQEVVNSNWWFWSLMWSLVILLFLMAFLKMFKKYQF